MDPRLLLVLALLLSTCTVALAADGPAIKDDISTPAGGQVPDDVLRLVRAPGGGKDLLFDAFPHPAAAGLRERLPPLIDDWLRLHAPQRQFGRPLFIRGDRFRLIGQHRAGDTGASYGLEIEATISRKPDSADGQSRRSESFRCSFGELAGKHPLEAWLAEDFARVRAASQQFLERCAGTAEQELGPLLAP